MKKEASRIEIQLAPVDRIIECASIMLLIFVFVYTFISYTGLPDKIPTHFNAAGQVDAYGSKSTVFFIVPFILIFYAALTLIGKHPNMCNCAVTITDNNREVQYTMVIRLLRVIKLELVALFTYIQTKVVLSALGSESGLGVWFLPVTLVAVFGTIGIYIYQSVKHK